MPVIDETADPRMSDDYVRRISGGRGDVYVIGVVHDHPASKYRVRTVIKSVDPDVLALELPPLAIPLFERYAAESSDRGGEMSAAIRAAESAPVRGIDGPTPAFVASLCKRVYEADVTRATVRSILRGLASVTRQAMACRLAAMLGDRAREWESVDFGSAHDCGVNDAPERQAADERARIARTKSLMDVFGEPAAVRVRDRTRERHMRDRLDALRTEGTVVSVIGIDHLDGVCDPL